MKILLLALSGLIIFTACNENKENERLIKILKAEKTALSTKILSQDSLIKKQQIEINAQIYKIKEQAKALEIVKIQKELEAKEKAKNDKLSKFGINIKNETISIDTNKTKDFFDTVSKSLEAKIKTLTTNIEKGIIDTKENGIDINKQHINIDLNKTKSFLETWGKKMQGFVKEFDDIAESMDIK